MATKKSLFKWSARLVLLIAFVTTSTLFYFTRVGLPSFVTDRIIAAASDAGIHIDLDRVTIGLPLRVIAHDIKIYIKGKIGPPRIEAAILDISLSMEDGVSIESAVITGGTVRMNIREPDHVPSDEPIPDIPRVAIRAIETDLQGLWLQDVNCRLSCSEGVLKVAAIRGTVGKNDENGGIYGFVIYDSVGNGYRGRFECRFMPDVFVPYIDKRPGFSGLAKVIPTFKFGSVPPSLQAGFVGEGGSNWYVNVDGFYSGRDLAYQTVPMLRSECRVSVRISEAESIVSLNPLKIERSDGEVNTRIDIDFDNDVVEFDGVSSIDPLALARMISEQGPGELDDFDFAGPVAIKTQGFVNYANPSDRKIKGSVSAANMGYRGFTFDRCSFRVLQLGELMMINKLWGEILDGQVNGSVQIFPDAESESQKYRVLGQIQDVALNKLLPKLSDGVAIDNDYGGKLSGTMRLTGLTGDGFESSVDGEGSLWIREGNILQLPLFGALSDMLVKIVPGMKYLLRQTDAETVFTVDSGVIKTDDFRIEGEVFSLQGDGAYSLPDDELNFDVELRFLKEKTVFGEVLQTVMLPMTKLFKVKLRGKVSDPEWSSVNF